MHKSAGVDYTPTKKFHITGIIVDHDNAGFLMQIYDHTAADTAGGTLRVKIFYPATASSQTFYPIDPETSTITVGNFCNFISTGSHENVILIGYEEA